MWPRDGNFKTLGMCQANKCITMWNFVKYLGALPPSHARHNKLGVHHRRGRVAMWAHVEKMCARPTE